MNGGVPDDDLWQRRHHRVCSHAHRLYNPPRGAVGKRFLTLLVKEIRMNLRRETNSERWLCLPACVLARSPGTFLAVEISRRVAIRMDLWEAGKFECLIQNISNDALRAAGNTRTARDAEADNRSCNSTFLDGKVRQAVRDRTSRSGGGLLSPDNICSKEGIPVIEVL